MRPGCPSIENHARRWSPDVAFRWTWGPIVATLSPMAEDTASGGTTDREPQVAELEHAIAGGESSAPAPDALRQGADGGGSAPVNKLHEWAAAIAIMIVLATILGSFIWFLRGPSM
jgi:hypothetical protein